MTLGGVLAVRNGFRLDYCWKEAATSLLPICDELVIADSDSDDGTREAIDEWARREPKITICNFPWTAPKSDPWWWPTFLNYSRQHLSTDHCVYLDADEILGEDSYDLVRQSAQDGTALLCNRYNFWRDEKHLIPHGHCCGHEVIRVGPQNLSFPSDYSTPHSGPIERMAQKSDVNIYHYGFLRKRDAFFRKAREVQKIWFNSYDQRLVEAEAAGGNWMAHEGVCGFVNNLVDFHGKHPELAIPWLKERGYLQCTNS